MHRRAFTLIELLVVVGIIAILAGLATPAFVNMLRTARMTEQMNNGKQILTAMIGYSAEISHGGSLPLYTDPDDPATLINTSNEAFEILLKGNYLDSKAGIFNRSSAWCKKVANDSSTKLKVQTGESDWCYVRGLRDTSSSDWPVLANAFAEGTTTYITNDGKKGGVWKGTRAVVIYRGGNGALVETKAMGDTYFIKRADNPAADAFVPDDDWLNGENIKVLYPKP